QPSVQLRQRGVIKVQEQSSARRFIKGGWPALTDALFNGFDRGLRCGAGAVEMSKERVNRHRVPVLGDTVVLASRLVGRPFCADFTRWRPDDLINAIDKLTEGVVQRDFSSGDQLVPGAGLR